MSIRVDVALWSIWHVPEVLRGQLTAPSASCSAPAGTDEASCQAQGTPARSRQKGKLKLAMNLVKRTFMPSNTDGQYWKHDEAGSKMSGAYGLICGADQPLSGWNST